jgi:hypothetical protein
MTTTTATALTDIRDAIDNDEGGNEYDESCDDEDDLVF